VDDPAVRLSSLSLLHRCAVERADPPGTILLPQVRNAQSRATRVERVREALLSLRRLRGTDAATRRLLGSSRLSRSETLQKTLRSPSRLRGSSEKSVRRSASPVRLAVAPLLLARFALAPTTTPPSQGSAAYPPGSDPRAGRSAQSSAGAMPSRRPASSSPSCSSLTSMSDSASPTGRPRIKVDTAAGRSTRALARQAARDALDGRENAAPRTPISSSVSPEPKKRQRSRPPLKVKKKATQTNSKSAINAPGPLPAPLSTDLFSQAAADAGPSPPPTAHEERYSTRRGSEKRYDEQAWPGYAAAAAEDDGFMTVDPQERKARAFKFIDKVYECVPLPHPHKLHIDCADAALARARSMLADIQLQELVYWNFAKDGFIIPDVERFSTLVLPHYFVSQKYTSFLRQLYSYGFSRVRRRRPPLASALSSCSQDLFDSWLNLISPRADPDPPLRRARRRTVPPLARPSLVPAKRASPRGRRPPRVGPALAPAALPRCTRRQGHCLQRRQLVLLDARPFRPRRPVGRLDRARLSDEPAGPAADAVRRCASAPCP